MNDESISNIATKILIALIILIFISPAIYNLNTSNNIADVKNANNVNDVNNANENITSNSEKTPIKHVIIVIEENHAFDNMFGLYPFGYKPIINNITTSLMDPEGFYSNISQVKSLNNTNGKISWISVPRVPWLTVLGSMNPYYANAYSTIDPYEGWKAYHGDYWFDTDKGFIYYSGTQSMAYFSYQQESILWDYAEEYTLYDNYFAPIMGFTEPNRIAYLTGEPPPFLGDDVSHAIPFDKSIMYQLLENNISWDYYTYDKSGEPWPLNAFTGGKDYCSHYLNFNNLYNNVKNNSLPAVSYVMMIGGSNDEYDLHPPYNMTAGSIELSDVINSVEKSKEWNSTAIFVTMDEGGGYYDNIIPPSINEYGLGQRIPLLTISPFSKEAYVNNCTLSGYSLLGFIDYNWNLKYITNYVKDSNVNGLLKSFNFSLHRSPLILTKNNWKYPMELQYPVHYGYIANVKSYKGYASVYNSGYISFLLPIDIISFSMLIASFRIKRLYIPATILMLITLSLSIFMNYYYIVYQYVTEYYMYSSLIGFIIVSLIFLKKIRGRSK